MEKTNDAIEQVEYNEMKVVDYESPNTDNVEVELEQPPLIYSEQTEIDTFSFIPPQFVQEDNSRIHQKEITYSCGAGVANVNLFTGRLLFEHSNFTLGAGNFQIGLSHIYNSHLPQGDIVANHSTRMGKGWKLNLQQYLVHEDGVFWKYIDANGMWHRFNALGDGRFHDTSGVGLILNPSNNTISDDNNNVMTFQNERLVRILSGINSQIDKRYNYNASGQLESIFDNRNSSRRFNFIYNNGLLERVDMVGTGGEIQRLNYFYDTLGRLVRISKTAGDVLTGQHKDKAYFTYATVGGLLESVIDAEDLSYLRFEYNNSLHINRVETGVMQSVSSGGTVVINIPAVTMPTVTGNQTITGQAITGFVAVAGRPARTVNLNFNSRDTEVFTYNTTARYTQVVRNNAVTLQYHYRHAAGNQAEVFSVLERQGTNDSTATFRSVIPNADTGIRLNPNIATAGTRNFDSNAVITLGSGTTQGYWFRTNALNTTDSNAVNINELNQTHRRRKIYD